MSRRVDKVRTGVSLSKYVVSELDDIVEECRDLGATRSEVINAIVHALLKRDIGKKERLEKIRGYLIKLRKGVFSCFFF